MNECRFATWSQVGTQVYRLPKFVYRIPISSTCSIIEHLGAVKERNDSRWNWWRFKSTFHQDWNAGGQGVAASKEAAMMRVLEGWDVPTEPES
jgi:hypothetical protein